MDALQTLDVDAQQLRAAVLGAISDLPATELHGLMARFVDAALEFETTSKIGPFQALARDLVRTAVMRRTAGFAEAVAAADEVDPSDLVPMSAADFLAHLERSA